MKNTLKKYSTALTALSLILVIVISGCTGDSGPVQQGGGDDVLDLTLETEGKTTFDSLEKFIISIQAENVGDFEVTNARARLQGYGGIDSASDEVLSDLKSMNPSTIEAADVDADLPGGIADVEWDVIAPFVSKDSPDREITITGEVRYDTKSLASQRVVVATTDYISTEDNVPISQKSQIINGPIEMDIRAGDPYVELPGTTTDFRVIISLDNEGSGYVYNADRDQNNYINSISLEVPRGINVDENNCDFEVVSGSGLNAPKTLVIDKTHNPSKLRLTEGGAHRDLSCTLTAHRDYVEGYNTFEISSTAEYTYIQTINKDLTIKGTEVSPLSVNILAPKRTNKGPWSAESQETMYVEVLYENNRVTEGLEAEDFKIWLETTLTGQQGEGHATAVEYHEDPIYEGVEDAEELPSCWEVIVYVPDMDAGGNETFDLSTEVNYFGSEASDISANSVLYEEA